MSNLSFKSTSKPFDNPKNQGIQRWAPIDPINHEKLTLLDTQTLERFYANYPLNAKQKTYKDFLISTQQGLALQQGPPGSGKTATAVAAIFETVMYRKKAHTQLMMLLFSMGNETDDTSEQYYTLGAHIVRLAKKKIQQSQPQIDRNEYTKWYNYRTTYATGSCLSEKECRVFNNLTNQLIIEVLANTQVVVSGCNSIGAPIYTKNIGYRDLVIRDEGENALQVETFILLNIPHGVLAISADDKQTEPYFVSKNHNKYAEQLKTTFFQRQKVAGWPIFDLSIQYRMHPHISEFSSMMWYDGVCDAPSTFLDTSVDRFYEDFMLNNEHGKALMSALDGENDGKNITLEGPKMHRLAIDIPDAFSHGDGWRCSVSCFQVINCVIRLIEEMLNHTPKDQTIIPLKPTDIVILDPCELDSRLTSKLLRAEGIVADQLAKVQVHSIEKFKGSEAEITILLLPWAKQMCGGSLEIYQDPKQLNVVLTRARRRQIIVGNWSHCRENIVSLNVKAPEFASMVVDLFGKNNVLNYSEVDSDKNGMKHLLPNISNNERSETFYWKATSREQYPTRHEGPSIRL